MSSVDRILEMVKERNHPTYPLTPQTVGLDGLTVENNVNYNTQVTMRSLGASTGYTGQVDLFYTRVGLDQLGDISLIQEEKFTLEDLLGSINTLKTAQMTPDDVTNAVMPDTETGVPLTFTLSAADSSLVWLGNVSVTVLNGIPASSPTLYNFLMQQAATLFPQP